MKKLVLDIGGTFIKYAIMDNEANIYEKGKKDTPHESLEQFIQLVCEIYETYQNDVDGIAISMPGNIDSDTGQIYTPGALIYNANTNIIEELHRYIDKPISVENDGKSAALAEVWKGHLSDCDDGIVLVLGSGIGGGIVHNRQLIKGKHFFAGEVSFLATDLSDVSMQNVFAMKGSTIALVARVAQMKGIAFESIDGKKVFEWIKAGDEDALKAFDDMTTALATEIYNLQCLLDPEKILIGGGVSKQEILIEKIQEKLDSIYAHFEMPVPRAQIDICKYHNDSNLIGALYNYQLHFGGKNND